MKVLIACEYSGTVRDAFIRKGHTAISCDILPTEAPGPHYTGDIRNILYSDAWDLVIAHPPCTYLAISGLHWNKRRPGRQEKTDAAIEFFMLFADLPCRYAIENPVCCISSSWRQSDQSIQPYEYGHDASKRTCLWLQGLPKLQPTQYIPPRIIDGKKRWSNQTASGNDRRGPTRDRAKLRSKTFQGIADAMAEQWSDCTKPFQLDMI